MAEKTLTAFWNWTRISLAEEDGGEREVAGSGAGPGDGLGACLIPLLSLAAGAALLAAGLLLCRSLTAARSALASSLVQPGRLCSRKAGRTTPPPPYDAPPSYHTAVLAAS